MRSGRIPYVPNQPATPNRTIRVPDAEWEAWREAAEDNGMAISEFVRQSVNNRIRRINRKKDA